MKNLLKSNPGIGALAAAALATALWVTGCQPLETGGSVTNRHVSSPVNTASDILNIGDPITVVFSDLPMVIPPFEERVKTDGTITLLNNQTFVAAGKSRGELEKEIRVRYVPSYYVNLTVTVKAAERFYFVDGEVKVPNRYAVSGETTVLKAIASAGGFTDFAKKSRVRITRSGGQTFTVDGEAAQENPSLDLPVYSGDKIYVPRRLW
jgi:protein involved in polysaccharide export with SLBB domain